MKINISERGQALVLVVFGIIVLIGMAALVVDGGNAYLDIRRAQNAADSAALSAALSRIRGENFVHQAVATARVNGYDNNGKTNSVQVFSPPMDGEHIGDIEYIQVVITSIVETYFGGIIGRDSITNRVSAISRTSTPRYDEILNGNAIISLAPESNCQNNKSFWVHGEATLDLRGGGIFVNSNNPSCALIEQGNGSIRIRDHNTITVVGGASIQKPALITPYPPKTGVAPISYPPPFMMPKISCGGKIAEVSEDGFTMSSGDWGDDFPPEGVISLESGNYCLDGDFIINDGQSLSGTNVVFFVKNGEIRWNGHATLDLSAPKKGTLAGLLIYMPIENRNRVILNGSAFSSVSGTILAPGARIIFKGGAFKDGFHSQIIGYTVEADGNSNIIIKYVDDKNYDAITMPEIELIK